MLHKCEHSCKEFKDKDAPYILETILGIEFRRCPLGEVDDKFCDFWIRAYQRDRRGQLVSCGTWPEQTNKYLEIMDYIQGLVSRMESNGK